MKTSSSQMKTDLADAARDAVKQIAVAAQDASKLIAASAAEARSLVVSNATNAANSVNAANTVSDDHNILTAFRAESKVEFANIKATLIKLEQNSQDSISRA
jgi:hypothetical protein